jgi:hypothetical protein
MIESTIVFSVILALAIYGILNALTQYVSIKWLSYTTKKKIEEQFNFMQDWSLECDDDCEVCEEETFKAPVKKAAPKKKTTRRK